MVLKFIQLKLAEFVNLFFSITDKNKRFSKIISGIFLFHHFFFRYFDYFFTETQCFNSWFFVFIRINSSTIGCNCKQNLSNLSLRFSFIPNLRASSKKSCRPGWLVFFIASDWKPSLHKPPFKAKLHFLPLKKAKTRGSATRLK